MDPGNPLYIPVREYSPRYDILIVVTILNRAGGISHVRLGLLTFPHQRERGHLALTLDNSHLLFLSLPHPDTCNSTPAACGLWSIQVVES